MIEYRHLWRNKWITAEATSIDEMIEWLQATTEVLREMSAAGVTLDAESGISDDHAELVTTDPAVAERYGFDEPEIEEDDEEEEDA
jgi:hypothetical protein